MDVKLHQDYADFRSDTGRSTLVICDGIGDYPDSGRAAKLAVDRFISQNYSKLSELVNDTALIDLKKSGIIGGTTFISAIHRHRTSKVQFEYLGNGGIIHLHGDFADNANTEFPYRYGNLMIPHVSQEGALTRHLSHNSGLTEMRCTRIGLNLNYHSGDIILLYSDGISSLEEKVIIADDKERFWRFEPPSIQFILKALDIFLMSNNDPGSFEEGLIQFNQDILNKLKHEEYLEDDASLGIIITEKVLTHYRAKVNDKIDN